MREPSVSWHSFARRSEMPQQRDRPAGPGRSTGDGRPRPSGTVPAAGTRHRAVGAEGRETPAPQSPTGCHPALPDAHDRTGLPERRTGAVGAVEPSAARGSTAGAAGDALPSLPEACRREILRAVAQAAGRQETPPSAASAAATDRGESDDAWRARAEGIARRTCRYVAALYDSNRAGRGPFVAGPFAPFCASCSSEAPTIELPPYPADHEPPVALHRVSLGVRAEPQALPGLPEPAGRRRRHRRVTWWALAVSATTLVGATAALHHAGPADGAPSGGVSSAPGATPGPTGGSPAPAAAGNAETGGRPATAAATSTAPPPGTKGARVTALPAVPDTPEPSPAQQRPTPTQPGTTGPQPSRNTPSLDPLSNRSAKPPVTVRPSPAPTPSETRRPSPDAPSGRPSASTTGPSSEPVPPSPSPGPAQTSSPAEPRPTAAASGLRQP